MLTAPENRKSNPLGVLFVALGFAAGYLGLRALPIEVRMRMYTGAAVGVLVALIPFFVARKRGQQKLAAISLIVGLVCGVAGGALLAVPAAIVLTIIAVRKPVPTTVA